MAPSAASCNAACSGVGLCPKEETPKEGATARRPGGRRPLPSSTPGQNPPPLPGGAVPKNWRIGRFSGLRGPVDPHHGRAVDHPPADPVPKRAPLGPGEVAGRPSSLPRSRRRTPPGHAASATRSPMDRRSRNTALPSKGQQLCACRTGAPPSRLSLRWRTDYCRTVRWYLSDPAAVAEINQVTDHRHNSRQERRTPPPLS